MTENDFQKQLKDRITERFPGAIVLKNDPSLNRGIPDLTVLYKDKWCALEVKKSAGAHREYAQIRKIQKIKSEMTYASFVYPENVEEVLNEMEQTFSS